MATITALSTGIQSITATGAVTPVAGVSVSGMTAATVCVEIISMTAGSTARIQLEDSVNAFTAVAALTVFDITGQMGQGGTTFAQGVYNPATDKRSIRSYQLPSSQIGVTNGVIRLNVTAISASSELVLNAWIET
jgi:hypothetical protein